MIRKVLFAMVVLWLGRCPAAADVHWTCSTPGACWADRGAAALEPWSPQPSFMEVFPDSQRQTIDGFGGCFNELEWTALNKLPAALRDSVVQSLYDSVSGCRFTMGRMPIGADDYSLGYYSHDDSAGDYAMASFSIARHQQNVIPFIKAAMVYRPDLRMWGSPWTPPAWMKTTGRYAGGSFIQTPQNLQAYALYLEKCVLAYQAAGLNFFALFVQNEPWSSSNYPTCLWQPSNLRDFVKFYLGPKFRADNVPVQLWYSTINSPNFSTGVAPALDDSVCRGFLAGVGYQWEGYRAMGSHARLHPEVPFWQTETRCGDGNNNWAWADTQFSDRKWAFDSGARAFFEWNMVLEKTGMSSWGWKQSAMISIDTTLKSVTYNPEYYVSKHFSYFVKPGARCISTAGSYRDKVAFINPSGDVVLVVRNGQAADSVVAIKIDSLMLLPKLPAHSFNTFVFAGMRPAFSSVAPQNRKPHLHAGAGNTLTDVGIFTVTGRKLFSGRNVRRAGIEADPRAFVRSALGRAAARQHVIILMTNGKSAAPQRLMVP